MVLIYVYMTILYSMYLGCTKGMGISYMRLKILKKAAILQCKIPRTGNYRKRENVGYKNSRDTTPYKTTPTIYMSRKFLHSHLCKIDYLFYGNTQTSFWTWYIS